MLRMDTRVYKEVNGCSIQMDIYDRGDNSPVMMYIHSGALIFGSRKWLPKDQLEAYLAAGFSVVSVDYRLAPETKLESIIEDIQDAMQWVRTKASEWYSFDGSRLVLIGSSAGGFLSLLMGTKEWRPSAIVSFYGYGDFLGDWFTSCDPYYCSKPLVKRSEAYKVVGNETLSEGAWKRFSYYTYTRQQGNWVHEVTGLDPTEHRSVLGENNPIEHVTAQFPPTLFLHGDQDTDVPYEQSVMMCKKLEEQGVYARLLKIDGADHAFDQNAQDPVVKRAVQQVIAFLRSQLQM